MQDSVVTQQQIDALERVLDKVFAQVGIDVEFTRHFLDRVNDERNRKQITVKELAMLFKKEFQRWGKDIAKLGPDQEAVMKDLDSDINIPFALKWNGSELELIAKTVMRKPNFRTTNKEFPVENIEDYAANFVKEMRDMLERELTGGEKRSKEAHFKKLKKHKGDFEKRYGDDAEGVMHGLATKRAKGESTETNPKHAVPDNRFTPGMNKGGEDGIAHHKTNKSLKRAISEAHNDMRPDHEVEMAKSDLYNLAQNSIKLYELIMNVSEAEGLEGWQQGKITQANDYITSVYQSMSHDMAMESAKRWKQTSMTPAEAEAEYGKENVKVKKGALRNGNDMVEVFVEGAMKRIATTQSNKAERIGAGGKQGLETYKKKTDEDLDDKEVDEFHKELDDLVHKHLGHSSDEKEESITEGQFDASDIMYEDPPIGIDFDFDNLPKVDWSKYSKEDIEKFVDNLENLDFEDGVDVSNTGYSGSYRKAANWVEKNVLNKLEQSAPKIDPDKWAEYQASKKKPKKVSSTQKALAAIRDKADNFVTEEQFDAAGGKTTKMIPISKGFNTRSEAQRHNDGMYNSKKASNDSYVFKNPDDRKYYVVDKEVGKKSR